MPVKNTRVRVEDIKHGAVIYVAKPVYGGIEKLTIIGKPYVSNIGSLFCEAKRESAIHPGTTIIDNFSLMDAGIIINHYNGSRAFFKKKQAERWLEMQKLKPEFQKYDDPDEDPFCYPDDYDYPCDEGEFI